MKKIMTISAGLLACFLSVARTPGPMDVRTYTLSNGMEVWINEDHSQPKVFGAVVVKSGAKDCPGTGIAHYFEHMMFKGTEKIGTVDYQAEKPYLDSIAVLYDQLAAEPSDSLRNLIQLEINRLNIAASEYAIPNEFNNLISECGGSDLNAYTSQDVTVYHNQFLPAYFEQWAELNSERLIDPVFRLFQSELETVYEEKNRAESNEFSAFANMIVSEGFKGSPYQYQIIGTTASLKNPQLSQMKAFFEKNYVAGNMGLMLTGDIDAAKALPVIEKTFGRIPKGKVDDSAEITLPPYEGRKDVEALAKIPVIKLRTLCYRAASKKDADCLPLSFLAFLLNNSEGVGMLDKLTTDHKISAAICMYPDMAFEDAGIFPILIMPRILFQSNKRAEKKVQEVLSQLKSGDFSEEYFNSCKQTYRKHLISQTESISSRMGEMVSAFSEGKKWEEVLQEADRINALTKEDVVALANKYLCDDCLAITKKFGNPEKDNLQKPPYKKVTPKNTGASSAYAEVIKAAAARVQMPRVIVDCVNGAERLPLSDCVTLYSVRNELNDVFHLTVSYPVGTVEQPALERVASYLSLLGTESLDYETHRSRLQALGGSIGITAGRSTFNIAVTGFDENFDEIVSLVSDLLDKPEGDRKKLKIIKESELSNQIMLRTDITELNSALFQKIAYGDDSYYLKDKGKIDDATLMTVFRAVQSSEFDVHYSGKLPMDKVAATLSGCQFVSKAENRHSYYADRKVALKDESVVYFVNKKRAPQSKIYAIVPGHRVEDFTGRFASLAFADYMGGGMGSVLFQELREFRSMAYSTGAVVYKPDYCNRAEQPTFFYAYLGTQSDKTVDAMAVLDSLIRNVPLDENRARMTSKNLWFERVNNYPGFRRISYWIANCKRSGIDEDCAGYLYDLMEQYGTDDVNKYWKDQIDGRNIVWAVVGDSKKIDMEALSRFGQVTEKKVKEIIK